MFLYINQRDGLSDTLLLRLLPEETSPKKKPPKSTRMLFYSSGKRLLKTNILIYFSYFQRRNRATYRIGGKKIETFYFLFGFN